MAGEYFGTDDGRDADRAAITRLMNGWIHCDPGQWDELAALFHPGATIDISWIEGTATQFIEASRTSRAPLRIKHLIGVPLVTFAGDRAFVETSAVIHMIDDELKLGVVEHNRFLDCVSMADGQWRINHRGTSYDMGWFTCPFGVAAADPVQEDLMVGEPVEYAPMAYLNARHGRPLGRRSATRGSDLEQAIRDRGAQWLAGA